MTLAGATDSRCAAPISACATDEVTVEDLVRGLGFELQVGDSFDT